jgi:hypothetical protein
MTSLALTRRLILGVLVTGMLYLTAPTAKAAHNIAAMPTETIPVLDYLMDMVKILDDDHFDVARMTPLMDFITSAKPADTIFTAKGSFNAPSAYSGFSVDTDIRRLVNYTLNADIPAHFLWPSSLRLTTWTHIQGGDDQFQRLQTAAGRNAPYVLRGVEQVTITPDQHTGAYYSYSVDKLVLLAPYQKGMALISIYSQQGPSAVGKKGWVLGKDEDWTYLYTQDTGLNIGGLGWASTQMYDSLGITVYYQPDLESSEVICGVVSWVKAGWAGINMVQPRHIHRGLVRVATAFKAILEDPRLPEPADLAQTFSKSRQLSKATLKDYAKAYYNSLEERLGASASVQRKIKQALDPVTLLDHMTRDELYAVLALDYFKKLLGRNPVMESHPF